MNDCQSTQYLGVGIITDDPHEALSQSAQLTTFVLRSFAYTAGGDRPDIDVELYLPHAQYYSHPITSKQTLRLAMLPATGTLRLPAEYIALVTLTTRSWRRGRPHVFQAADVIVTEFLRRTQRAADQVTIERVPYTRAQSFFACQVSIRQRELSSVRAVAG